jgi:hypothetical protein
LNATPKTLWDGFTKKSKKGPDRLTTVMSTVTDSKHGDRESHSEVPRDALVRELQRWSTLRTTQELESNGQFVLTIPIELT